MANPQIENGHLKIANEVFEHLMKLRVSCSELQICMAVIRQTWGWKKKSAPISLLELQKLTDYPERTVAQAVTSLSAKKILICDKGGGRGNPSKWAFNKDWEKWETLHKHAEKINSAQINTVYSCSQTLQGAAEITAETCRVSPDKPIEIKEQLAPKAIFKAIKENIYIYKSKPCRRVPEGFIISNDMKEWAKTNAADVDIICATEEFKDYEFKNAHTDWKAAWRNWIRNQIKFGNGNGSRRKQSQGDLSAQSEDEFEDPDEKLHGDPKLIEDERTRRRAKYNNDPAKISAARSAWRKANGYE